jgi:hypothetical protein
MKPVLVFQFYIIRLVYKIHKIFNNQSKKPEGSFWTNFRAYTKNLRLQKNVCLRHFLSAYTLQSWRLR